MCWPRSVRSIGFCVDAETMRAALNALAVVAPDWLRAHSQPEWVERYGPRSEDSRSPLGEAERLAFAEEIGQQGRELFDTLFDPTAPQWLRQVPAVEILTPACGYKFTSGSMMWNARRSSENIPPPSRYIGSPGCTKRLITVRRGVPHGWAIKSI